MILFKYNKQTCMLHQVRDLIMLISLLIHLKRFTSPEAIRAVTSTLKTMFNGPRSSWRNVDLINREALWQHLVIVDRIRGEMNGELKSEHEEMKQKFFAEHAEIEEQKQEIAKMYNEILKLAQGNSSN
ncbi:unnamed protein product [Lactuca virosa]|uniref:Uncharacterized protein n=1 Tax=Lactuca virosa TaxID=75947 RepID=A0AAU9M087_9ASTR|nr:unnamed protein product [Lactuca virosa]